MGKGLLRASAMGALSVSLIAGCGGGERQDANEPEGSYRLEVVSASFPTRQSLADKTQLQIEVRNADDEKVPQVAVTIAQGLADGTTTAGSVARILGMSTRTLTRRLSEEGTSFGSILDQLRADLAVRYIQDLKVPIAEIAWRLGYKEPSAFTVAFKRWTGRPPAAIRREQRDKSPTMNNVARQNGRGSGNIRRSVRGHRA